MANKNKALWKAKHKNPKNNIEFEEIIENLNEVMFNSVYSERRRTYVCKKNIKLWILSENKSNEFKKLVSSYLKSVGLDEAFNSLKELSYVHDKSNKLNKISINHESFEFKNDYIIDDAIYSDEFKFKAGGKGSTILTVSRTVKLPIPLEVMSLNAWVSKMHFKKAFTYYVTDIRSGMGDK